MLGVALAAAGVLVAAVALARKMRADRHSWRAAKVPEVRQVLTELRRLTQELIAHGGQSVWYFEQEPAQRAEQHLSDLAAAVNDEQLRERCRAVGDAWTRMFGWAPPHRVVVRLDEPPDPDRMRRRQEQVTVAHECQQLIEQALRRVVELERRVRPT